MGLGMGAVGAEASFSRLRFPVFGGTRTDIVLAFDCGLGIMNYGLW